MSKRQLIGVLAAALVSGIGVGGPPDALYAQGPAGATAALVDANGQAVGSATFAEQAGGVRIAVQARGLQPGEHGIHLHAVGRCEGPAFASAGGHFNPAGRQHGLHNPQGHHAGDLPALTAMPDGSASFSAISADVTLAPGPASLLDADGAALVIHADPDDQVTDPAGNAGARIACGTIVAAASALPATGSPAWPAGGVLAPSVFGALLAGAGTVAAGVFRVRRRSR